MLRIAVSDDNEAELTHVTALLKQYQEQNRIAARIDVFHNAVELMEALRTVNYHLLLLDILMPGFTGIQAARELRSFDAETQIIFLTSSPEFVVESYAVGAFYYLLKPIKGSDLFPVLDKLMLRLHQTGDTLMLTTPQGVIRLPYSRIEVMEVNSKHLVFYMNDGSTREISGTLTEYEPRLLQRREFAKVHRSYLVNMDYVQNMTRSELITDAGVTVPISRLLSNQVRKAYMDFLFRREDGQP